MPFLTEPSAAECFEAEQELLFDVRFRQEKSEIRKMCDDFKRFEKRSPSMTDCDACSGLACGDECDGKSHATRRATMDSRTREALEGVLKVIDSLVGKTEMTGIEALEAIEHAHSLLTAKPEPCEDSDVAADIETIRTALLVEFDRTKKDQPWMTKGLEALYRVKGFMTYASRREQEAREDERKRCADRARKHMHSIGIEEGDEVEILCAAMLQGTESDKEWDQLSKQEMWNTIQEIRELVGSDGTQSIISDIEDYTERAVNKTAEVSESLLKVAARKMHQALEYLKDPGVDTGCDCDECMRVKRFAADAQDAYFEAIKTACPETEKERDERLALKQELGAGCHDEMRYEKPAKVSRAVERDIDALREAIEASQYCASDAEERDEWREALARLTARLNGGK